MKYEYRERSSQRSWPRRLLSFLVQIAVVAVLAAFLVLYIGNRVPMSGHSMESTVMDGGSVLVNRTWYLFQEPERFDVIACRIADKLTIKRILALPGETILIREGQVWINDERLEQSEELIGTVQIAGIASEALTLGEGEYFVIGDNPIASEDSRNEEIGPLSADQILGKAWFFWNSTSQFGWLS